MNRSSSTGIPAPTSAARPISAAKHDLGGGLVGGVVGVGDAVLGRRQSSQVCLQPPMGGHDREPADSGSGLPPPTPARPTGRAGNRGRHSRRGARTSSWSSSSGRSSSDSSPCPAHTARIRALLPGKYRYTAPTRPVNAVNANHSTDPVDSVVEHPQNRRPSLAHSSRSRSPAPSLGIGRRPAP